MPDEKSKLQLLELLDYCQSNGRICPSPQYWNKIYHVYSWHTDKHKFTKYPPFKIPLIVGAWNASDIEKRQRFLTHIYWCYKNHFMDSMHTMIMKLTEDDWCYESCSEDAILLELVKKEYATWLGVNFHPKHEILRHCIIHNYEYTKESYDCFDDKSTTYTRDR